MSGTTPDPAAGMRPPEWRCCPITGRWVTIARERSARPFDFRAVRSARQKSSCPFCAGHEDETPAEVLAVRDERGGSDNALWRVRVVPNKYPAVDATITPGKFGEGPLSGQSGFGVHEVIIESPDHITSTSQLTADQFADVLWAYRQRLLGLRHDARLRYGLIFKNLGESAGASLEHLHSQLLATPMTPATVIEELTAGQQHHRQHGRCIYCDLIAAEIAAGERVVLLTNQWIAFCPWASRFAYETWILPRQHASHFEAVGDADLRQFAAALHGLLMRLESVLPVPAYNYFLHTSPFDTTSLEYYHWHLEILPRMTTTAGFEWGSGFAINPLPPEEAAATLRNL